MDPIDNVPAPGADFMMDRHEAGGPDGARYAPQEITSVREMLLIIAEANLADGNTSGFVTAINGLRAMDGLSPYDPATHTVDFFQYRASRSRVRRPPTRTSTCCSITASSSSC
jgi:hypothetical protein